jgi:hypothetical protein
MVVLQKQLNMEFPYDPGVILLVCSLNSKQGTEYSLSCSTTALFTIPKRGNSSNVHQLISG